MSLINQGTISTQLQTILNGLTLSTEQLTRISTLAKTAVTAGADTSSIITQLQSRMNSVTDLESAVLLSIVSGIVSENMVISVANTASLTSSNTSPGSIVYVESEGAPYIKKTDNTWVLIEPTLQPAVINSNISTWGFNGSGQLGNGTTTNISSPVSITGSINDWKWVSGGINHSLAIRSNGTAWAWGFNGFNQLGDGTSTNRSSPVLVVGGFTDWIKLDAGIIGSSSIGLRGNGTVWTWGSNVDQGFNIAGQLGNNTSVTTASSPVSVVGGFTDWTDIAQGWYHCLGLRANGTAWAWGTNGSGELGNGDTTRRSSPVSVIGGFTDWTNITGGTYFSVGVRANGTAWAWGLNSVGNLGDNSITNRSSPVSVVGGFTDWVQVDAGSGCTLGLRANGTLWAWGGNTRGQLGDGTTTNRSSPVSVVGGFTDWVQASISYTGVGLRANGTAWAWGRNVLGQIGNSTTTSTSSPVSISGGISDWVLVSAGYNHSAAVRGAN